VFARFFPWLCLLGFFLSSVRLVEGQQNQWPTGGADAGRRTPLTAEEMAGALADEGGSLRRVVEALEASVSRGDSGVFDSFLRAEWLLDTITRPVAQSAGRGFVEMEAAFEQGTRASWAKRSLASDYLGHHFRFLRVQSLAGRPGLLFRAAGDGGQLNYCLLTVTRDEAGRLGADDVYVAGMAEWVSDTLRRGFLTLMESLEPRGESGRRAELYIAALPVITGMQLALSEKNHQRVLSLAEGLPPELLQDRQILLTCVEAAEHHSLTERRRWFGRWMALYPDPEQLPLKWADYHTAVGLFDDARSALSQLNERLGGDSHLMLRLGELKMLARHHAAGRLLGERPGPEVTLPGRAENVR